MQNVEGMGDFDHYQGIWRLQRLPNCAPNGGDAARLTYAVEIRPKGFLPVSLIEGRIAGDLKNNLDAIRRYVQARTTQPQLAGGLGLSSGSDGADADAGVDGGGLSLLEEDVVVAQTGLVGADACAGKLKLEGSISNGFMLPTMEALWDYRLRASPRDESREPKPYR